MGVTERVLVHRDILLPVECERLILRWHGSHRETGYIPKGETETVIDRKEKYRFDNFIRSGKIFQDLCQRMNTVLGNFHEYEPFRIGCYRRGGHFRVHNDAVLGRRYSLVVMLSNPDAYRGGALVFPDLGLRVRAPRGAMVVFDSTLRHGVHRVTAGARFVLITFALESAQARARSAQETVRA